MQIFGEQDEDGFFYGECNGNRGLVPYNMISEVRMEEGMAGSELGSDLISANYMEQTRRWNNFNYYNKPSHVRVEFTSTPDF